MQACIYNNDKSYRFSVNIIMVNVLCSNNAWHCAIIIIIVYLPHNEVITHACTTVLIMKTFAIAIRLVPYNCTYLLYRACMIKKHLKHLKGGSTFGTNRRNWHRNTTTERPMCTGVKKDSARKCCYDLETANNLASLLLQS